MPELRGRIGEILGVDKPHKMIIIGAGNIGHAVACAESFPANGFETVAIFDSASDKVGTQVNGIPVQDISSLERYIAENPVDIAVLAVPVEAAQALTDQLYQYGIRGFWNFTPCDLKMGADAAVVNVHLDEGLQVLSFRMLHKQD